MKRTLLFLAVLLLCVAVKAEPHITSVQPAHAWPAGGTYVYISGYGLVLDDRSPSPVSFGGVTATLVNPRDSSQIVVIAPPHDAGPADIVIHTFTGTITLPGGFLYGEPDSTEYETLLLPVTESVRGANGSLWEATTTISNTSDSPVFVQMSNCDRSHDTAPCPPTLIGPHETIHPRIQEWFGLATGVLVPRGALDSIDVQLRIQDISRQSQTFGTSIPVVRRDQFRRVVRLHDIPTDPQFRSTLRIYGCHPLGAIYVNIRLFDESSAKLIASTRGQGGPLYFGIGNPFSYPEVTITSLLNALPEIAAYPRIGIEVDSIYAPQDPLWAFVSVTNNETQHVTIIAPD